VRGLTLGLLCVALLPAIAHARPRIAILPVDTIGVPASRGERLRAALAGALEEAGVAEVVPHAEIDAALPAEPKARSACLEDASCLEALARRVNAELALTVTLGGMGDTHLVRLRMHDVERGVAAREVRETVIGSERTLMDQARGLAVRMMRDPERPWYARWWAWAAIGVGVAASVAIPLALRGDEGNENIAKFLIP